MYKDWPQLAKELSPTMAEGRKSLPDAWGAFANLAKAATAPSALDTKTKELIALAIGIAVRCDGCLAFHAKAVAQHGGTRAEVLDTIAMAIYMGGGPSAIYGAQALEAFDQFAAR
ncbi:MAG: carboxymuconolactone decarboxylase family protein [Azospirillum sp.]|nr:carboxymuconolactone decarboxylase family protein [Azospirillum sp.]